MIRCIRMAAGAPINSALHVQPASAVLGYGTRLRVTWQHRLLLVLLLALVLPTSWWSSIRTRQWYAERQSRAAIGRQIDQNLSDSKQATSDGRWRDAQVAIDKASYAASSNSALFGIAEGQAFHTRIDEAQRRLQQIQEQWAVCEVPQPSLRMQLERERSAALRKAVDELIGNADLLLDQGSYTVATRLLQRAVRLDPANEHAISLLREATAVTQPLRRSGVKSYDAPQCPPKHPED